MDQPPAVALTAFADAWPRAIETEIGAALCAIRRGKDFDFDISFDELVAQFFHILRSLRQKIINNVDLTE